MRRRDATVKRISLVKVFFTVFFSMLFVFGAFVAIGVAYLYYAKGVAPAQSTQGFLSNILPSVPKRTNVVVFGLDEDKTRTDFIMVGTFNSETKKLDLISIPRDTYVELPKDRLALLKQDGIHPPTGMKINEVHSRVGKKYNTEFAVKQVEDLLSIHLDYYIKVDFDAFQYIINSIGGIDIDVPQDMHYEDPDQHLYINLKAGPQTLNGEQAEGLVRYRKDPSGQTKSYPLADLDRIKVQQMFMKAFFAKALSADTVTKNAMSYVSALAKYVDTNIGPTDAVQYIRFLEGFSPDNITAYTLPGTPKNIHGASYYLHDEAETAALVYDVFVKDPNAPLESSMGKGIVILNGGYQSGLAGDKRQMLEDAGFTVSDVGDSREEKTTNTRIFVRRDGQGQDLLPFFKDATVIVDAEATTEYEIIIILGTDEPKNEPKS